MAALQQIHEQRFENLKRLQEKLQIDCEAYLEEIDMKCIEHLTGFTWMDYLS